MVIKMSVWPQSVLEAGLSVGPAVTERLQSPVPEKESAL